MQSLQMSQSEKEEAKQFRKHLFDFWQNKQVVSIKIPQIGGRELDLYQLYKAVCKRGGAELVSNNKLWKDIVNEFGLPSSCTSASFTLRNHYSKYLLAYEQKYFFGRDEEKAIKELAGARQRKIIKYNENYLNDMNIEVKNSSAYWEGPEQGARAKTMLINGPFRIHQHTNRFNSIKKVLSDRYKITNNPGYIAQEKETLNSQVYYIRKQKMQPTPNELQRIVLCLEGKVKNEVYSALNSLLLFSVNYSQPVHLDNLQELVEALTDFLYFAAGQLPEYKEDLGVLLDEYQDSPVPLCYDHFGPIELREYLRTIFQVLRNFSLVKGNEHVLFKNEQLFTLVFGVFMQSRDTEAVRLALESLAQMGSYILVKQHPQGLPFLRKLAGILHNQAPSLAHPEPHHHLTEAALECFCNLFGLSENEQILEQVLTQSLSRLNQLLVSETQSIRELTLKLLSYLSDLKMVTRNLISQLDRCPQRLVALLSSQTNSKEDKLSKLALNIIGNLVISDIGKHHFAQFQNDMFIVSSTDQVLSKGLATIIYELQKLQEQFCMPK